MDSIRRRPRFIAVSLAALVGAITLIGACSGGDVVSVPHTELRDRYWALSMDIPAATVALDATQQLTATPITADGDPIPDLPKPTFTSQDSTLVSVDANGLITAHKITSGIPISATLTVDGVTHTATTTVAVTATAVHVKSIKLTDYSGNPIPTRLNLGQYASITTTAVDTNDQRVYGLAVSVHALDPRVIYAAPSYLAPKALGQTKIVVSTTSYGQALTDTITVGVGYPSSGNIYITGGDFSPSAVAIAVNGSVTWINYNYDRTAANVVFDQPDAIPGGNIDSLGYVGSGTRVFTTPGTYTFTNTFTGKTGKVIVREQPVY